MIPVILGLGLGLGLSASPAHAALPVTMITLPALDASAANPNGLALDALNWAGEGNNSTCSTGAGVVNSPVGMYKAASAGCAADWQLVTVPGSSGVFQIQYNPNGKTSADLCVSTIGNTAGVHMRLRPCATGPNVWQDFKQVTDANVDITNAVLIEDVASGLAMNDKGFGGNQSPVISWPASTSQTAVNQIWNVSAAA